MHRPMGYTIIAHRYISKTNTQSTQAGTAARQKRSAVRKEKGSRSGANNFQLMLQMKVRVSGMIDFEEG